MVTLIMLSRTAGQAVSRAPSCMRSAGSRRRPGMRRSFARAMASSWRTRSRLTPISLPASNRVRSLSPSSPNRSRSTSRSRGASSARMRCNLSDRSARSAAPWPAWAAASSDSDSPRVRSSSCPTEIGVSSYRGDRAARRSCPQLSRIDLRLFSATLPAWVAGIAARHVPDRRGPLP